jgi:hypothetical protein
MRQLKFVKTTRTVTGLYSNNNYADMMALLMLFTARKNAAAAYLVMLTPAQAGCLLAVASLTAHLYTLNCTPAC